MVEYVVVVLAILLSVLLWGVKEFRLKKFSLRGTQEKAWRKVFPKAKPCELNAFLDTFIREFMLPPLLKLRLRPDDSPMEIYKIVVNGSDSMEFESFLVELELRFNCELGEEFLQSQSLGEMFGHVVGRYKFVKKELPSKKRLSPIYPIFWYYFIVLLEYMSDRRAPTMIDLAWTAFCISLCLIALKRIVLLFRDEVIVPLLALILLFSPIFIVVVFS